MARCHRRSFSAGSAPICRHCNGFASSELQRLRRAHQQLQSIRARPGTGACLETTRQIGKRRGKEHADLALQAIEPVATENSCIRRRFAVRVQLPESVLDIVQRDTGQQPVTQRQTIPGRSRLAAQRALTSSACRPFCPWVTLNSTFWPSTRVRCPSPRMARKCTNTSGPDSR